MDVRDLGLVLTISPVAIGALVLLFNLSLWAHGHDTISQAIWNDLAAWRAGNRAFPKRALWLVAGLAVAPLGLAIHFFL